MTMDVDGDAVWSALLAESTFRTEVPEEQLPILKPFVKALPDILKDLLDEPVTLKVLMSAKVTFLRYCLDNGIIGRFVEVTPAESLFLMDKDGLRAMLEEALNQALSMFEAIVENVSAFLRQVGKTEEQVLTSLSVGLSVENAEKYNKGALTMADLLLTQPSIIVKNTD